MGVSVIIERRYSQTDQLPTVELETTLRRIRFARLLNVWYVGHERVCVAFVKRERRVSHGGDSTIESVNIGAV
jgi:hypothetical protein